MHGMELPKSLLAVARAGAGVNNIPLDKCAEQGIVVFNTPGANANGVKELVLAGMLLASRDIAGGIEWGQNKQIFLCFLCCFNFMSYYPFCMLLYNSSNHLYKQVYILLPSYSPRKLGH